MRKSGKIIIRGIVQGVGFRPFVYAKAKEFGISGSVKNLGSEVEICAEGEQFENFADAVRKGPPLSRIDSFALLPLDCPVSDGFDILPSGEGTLSGMIPPDIAVCDECLSDISRNGGRYEGYWATSCVNCGPRYSIIDRLPYDRERTSMNQFHLCGGCDYEYRDPASRRHHAQTIACPSCGPRLALLDPDGNHVETGDIIREAALLLDNGSIIAVRGIGGFHIACIEESAAELKKRLGRSEQPFAVMVRRDRAAEIARMSTAERLILESIERPIVVLEKLDPRAHPDISNLHTIGSMLPYTGLHHLLFEHLTHPLLIMTSANMPGYPMITDIDQAMAKLNRDVDFFLTHDRRILNRCDDSVVRDGFIIRLSRGMAPKRTAIDLGRPCILAVGPELNANISIYKDGFCTTSPHVGNVRNPRTFEYLKETVEKTGSLLGADYDIIAHDAHPQFLSTRYARELAAETGAELVAVQHHRAHVAASTDRTCIGITIDGVGHGDDGTVWGGEIFAGQVPEYERVAHLEVVPMPGGDLATTFPERMLYGILPEPEVSGILASRGWTDVELGILDAQLKKGLNVARTSSCGRVLDAVAALLNVCREKTYDGEPAMRLESSACNGSPRTWDLEFLRDGICETLSTRSLCRRTLTEYLISSKKQKNPDVSSLAASFQYNLARGIAGLAIHAARDRGTDLVTLSGGVAYNKAIRETIIDEVRKAGLTPLLNADYPLGDGCISYGQCVYAGKLKNRKKI